MKGISKTVALSLKRDQRDSLQREWDNAARTVIKNILFFSVRPVGKESPKRNQCLFVWDNSKSRSEKSQPQMSSTLITGSAHRVCLQV